MLNKKQRIYVDPGRTWSRFDFKKWHESSSLKKKLALEARKKPENIVKRVDAEFKSQERQELKAQLEDRLAERASIDRKDDI